MGGSMMPQRRGRYKDQGLPLAELGIAERRFAAEEVLDGVQRGAEPEELGNHPVTRDLEAADEADGKIPEPQFDAQRREAARLAEPLDPVLAAGQLDPDL